MTPDLGADAAFTLLLLVLPVMALASRRVPVLRTLGMLLAWGAIFAVGLLLFGQRDRVAPYLERAGALFNLDDQKVVGREVRIRMAPDGHFWAAVSIDGVRRKMLIDSGATFTALSSDTAADAGLDMNATAFPTILNTANGTIAARTARVGELRVGDVVARDLSVVVSPAFGDTDVLGMNFLSKLKAWRVEGRTLILTPHHPQDFT